MTLLLERGTKPANLGIKTIGFGDLGNTVFLGEYEISLEDFLFAAEYVLTNTNLGPTDPRRQFVKCVQFMTEVEGYNGPMTRRLKALEPMIFPKYVREKRIRIIAVPPGQAPEEVRKQWIGVEIPLSIEQDAAGFDFGVFGGKPDPRNMTGYKVDIDEAICALTEKNTAESSMATKWWIDWRENTLSGRMADAFTFAKEVCELIP